MIEKQKVKLTDKHVYEDNKVILTVNIFEQNMVMAEFIRKRELKKSPCNEYWSTIYFNPTNDHLIWEYANFVNWEMKGKWYKEAREWFLQLIASLFPDCSYLHLHPEEYKRPKDTKVFCQEFVWVFAPNLVTRL